MEPQDDPQTPLTHAFLSAMRVLRLDEDTRCMCLGHMRRFFLGRQHDGASSSWDGAPRDPGVGYLHERLKPQGFVPTNSAQLPLSRRSPSAPVPLAKQIVTQFTDMLLGEGRLPTIRCRQDEDDELFMQAVFREAETWDVLSQARDVCGSCGAAVIVNGIITNKPFMEVLYPEDVWVPEWDKTNKTWRPLVVVHQILIDRTEQNEESGRLETKKYWQTRAWTSDEIIVYKDVEENKIPKEGIQVKERTKHPWGRCPVIWYQNTRATETPDGEADCEGTWPLLDQIDRLNSQGAKAAIANADPTVVLQDSERRINRGGQVRKGSGHVIAVGPDGDAKYLEINGKSIEAAFSAVDKLTQQVLQTTRCVVASPEMVRSNESGEARQILWRSMESRANRLRVGLQNAVTELADLWRIIGVKNPELDLPDQEVKNEEGESEWVSPKAVGSKANFTIEFPPYWTPTAAQLESFARGLSIAAGAKPVFSIETSARAIADFIGTDPDTEWQRVKADQEEAERMMTEQLKLKGSVNLPNGPKPDQPGEPTAGNKPARRSAAAQAKKPKSGNGVSRK